MNLISNWKDVARRAHSMWAQYLGLLCLLLPDLIYLALGVDTNPRLWWWLAVVLIAYGVLGRLWDQRIDPSKTHSPWGIGVVVLVAVVAMSFGERVSHVTNVQAVDVSAAPNIAMPVSEPDFVAAAVPFIGKWEGLRLEAYRDVVGVWTVCFGETKGVKPGDSYTRAQCEAMLAREVVRYRNGLHQRLSLETKATRLPRGRDVAFTSLAYNVGVSGAGRSTAVKRLNAGDIAGACEALTWWNKGGGRVIRGLVRRRADERELCLQGVV